MTTMLTIRQLEQATWVDRRTLRHWIHLRLLPKPVGRGRAARYTQEHVLRADAVRHLRSEHASLKSIRLRISQLSEEQLMALQPAQTPDTAVAAASEAAIAGQPTSPPAPIYPFQSWEVVTLIDGLVLLVNAHGGPPLRRLADEIFRYYGRAQG